VGIPGKVGLTKQNIARGVASIFFLAGCASSPIEPQQPRTSAQPPTIRVQSSLVLVDVIAQDPESGLPIRDFKKEDFRMFDNRREVRVATFDAGARYDTRSITLWLVVICNEGGIVGASAEFAGKESTRLHWNVISSSAGGGAERWRWPRIEN
jgi:hypothetical protein